MISTSFPILFLLFFTFVSSYDYIFWESSSTLSSSHLIELTFLILYFNLSLFSAFLSYILCNFIDLISSVASETFNERLFGYLCTQFKVAQSLLGRFAFLPHLYFSHSYTCFSMFFFVFLCISKRCWYCSSYSCLRNYLLIYYIRV